MKRIKLWIKWFAAVGTALVFAAGVPVLLLASPSPVDPDRGVRSIIDAVATGSQVFEEALVSVVVVIAWALWAYLMIAAAFALIGSVRGAVLNVSGFGFGQRLVAPVISALMWSSTATSLALSVVGGGGLALATSAPASAQVIDEPETTGPETDIETSTNVGQISGNLVLVNGHTARAHVVAVEGDTMWDLAQKHLGDAFRWSEIAELNVGADLIWPDTVLLMPDGAVGVVAPSAEAMETFCRLNSGTASTDSHEVVVVEGDTLWDLAGQHLGDEHRWPELAAGTVGVAQAETPVVTDPDLIWPGTVVQVPGSGEVEAVVAEDCEPELPIMVEGLGTGVPTDGTVVVGEVPVWTAENAEQPATKVAVSEIETTTTTTTTTTAASSTVVGTPWWLIAAAASAAAVFGAGMLKALSKRRERANARGEEFDDDLLEEFDEPARSVRDHLLAASASLAQWVTEADVVMFQVDRDRTSAVFVGDGVQPHSSSPWKFGKSDGSLSTWTLAHDEVDAAQGSYCLWGFSGGIFFNLEELASIGIAGPHEDLLLGVVRHMLHDVLGNFGQDHDVIVRVGAGVAEIDEISCYGVGSTTSVEQMRAEIEHLFTEVDGVHEARGTELLAEMRDEDAPYPTLLMIVTPEERSLIEDLQRHLEASPGRYPIVMLTIGAGATGRWTLRVESDRLVTIGSDCLGEQRLTGEPLMMERDEALRISYALGGVVDAAAIAAFTPIEPVEISDAPTAKAASYLAAMAAAGIEANEDEAPTAEPEADADGELVVVEFEADADDSMLEELSDEFDEDDCESDFEHEEDPFAAGGEADWAIEDEDENTDAAVAEQMADAFGSLAESDIVAANVDVVDGDNPEDLLFELVDTNGVGGKPKVLENPVGPGHRVAPPVEQLEVSPGAAPEKVLALATGAPVGALSLSEVPDVRFFGRVTVEDTDLSAAAVAGAAILAWFGPMSRERWTDLLWNGKSVSERRVREVVVEIRRQWGPVFSDLDGVLSLRALSDVALAQSLIDQSAALEWPAASVRLLQASELCCGEIFAETPGGRWWQWTGVEVATVRQDHTSNLLAGFAVAAQRARAEGDAAMVERLCVTARRVDPVAMAPVEMLAECFVQNGQRHRALQLVEDWEQRYEDRFDEDPPETLRLSLELVSLRTG